MRFVEHDAVAAVRDRVQARMAKGKVLQADLEAVGQEAVTIACPTHICRGKTFALRFADVQEMTFEPDDLATMPSPPNVRYYYRCPNCGSETYVREIGQEEADAALAAYEAQKAIAAAHNAETVRYQRSDYQPAEQAVEFPHLVSQRRWQEALEMAKGKGLALRKRYIVGKGKNDDGS